MTSARRHVPALVAPATALVLLGGCASAGSKPRVGLLRVDAPLQEPVWVPEEKVVLALDEDRRQVVRVNVGEATLGTRALVHSVELEDVGENLALSPEEPELAFLPRPGSGRISALDTDSLRVVDSYNVGASPTYATLDVQSEVLFTLSRDGSTVSGVGIETPEEIPDVDVGGGPGERSRPGVLDRGRGQCRVLRRGPAGAHDWEADGRPGHRCRPRQLPAGLHRRGRPRRGPRGRSGAPVGGQAGGHGDPESG